MGKKGLNIHKRSDGRWEGRYKIGVCSNGSTKFASVYGRSYDEAMNKLSAAKQAKSMTQNPIGERTFSEVMRIWLNNNRLKLKGATEHKYRTMIELHVEPVLGNLKLSNITSVTINSFLAGKMKSGRLNNKGELSASYVRTMAMIIQSVMRFAADEEYCNPLKTNILKPVQEKKELQVLSKEDQAALEGYIFRHFDSLSLCVLITLYAGLRIGEICALSWDDIDLNRGIIHIRHTVARVRNTNPNDGATTKLIIDSPKTSSSVRDIPISSALFPYLTEMKKQVSIGFIASETNNFVSPRTYEYRFHRMLDCCGIPQVNYHVLRHTFATRCVEAGMDVKSLSELLGHANVGVTLNTYVHSSLERKRQQLEKLHA